VEQERAGGVDWGGVLHEGILKKATTEKKTERKTQLENRLKRTGYLRPPFLTL